ncbi:hypothetical protein M758_1G257100 [Ceratodon purpureus]|uniref:Uncharacterized protein n=1 Tax=Ceratodon purpureus TaxID=3225 RepID=A0A8T0J9I4_CERPU|nr:hypothetical protein KC19_1G263500 [Ceratodon purpureus]KAG0631485.1 hypothetical protein M758_1G257100 [Ceratodon purpureus]
MFSCCTQFSQAPLIWIMAYGRVATRGSTDCLHIPTEGTFTVQWSLSVKISPLHSAPTMIRWVAHLCPPYAHINLSFSFQLPSLSSRIWVGLSSGV